MNLTQQLQRINLLSSNVGANISNSREFYEFESASEFIDETIEVLSTDNLSHKKNYFLDFYSTISICQIWAHVI